MNPDVLSPQHYASAADYLAATMREDFLNEVEGEDFGTESPIEQLFLVWFKAHQRAVTWSDPFVQELQLLPQREVTVRSGKKYRLDFVVSTTDADLMFAASKLNIPGYSIGVELDGHDFHEKTKQQVALRNSRDRELQSLGWRIFHYSGSELHRDPLACITEVCEHAGLCHERLWTRVHEAKKAGAGASA